MRRLLGVAAYRGRAFNLREMRGGVDDLDMRESPRKVAEQAPRARIVLLGHQPEIVAHGQQALEQAYRVATPADQAEAVRQPEAARKKRALAAGKPVETGTRRIAGDKTIAHQLPLDRLNRAADARIFGLQEAELWDQQQRGVEIAAAVILDERVALAVITIVEDLLAYPFADPLPMVAGALHPVLFDRLDRPVERDPAHDLRKSELARFAAYLPHSVI